MSKKNKLNIKENDNVLPKLGINNSVDNDSNFVSLLEKHALDNHNEPKKPKTDKHIKKNTSVQIPLIQEKSAMHLNDIPEAAEYQHDNPQNESLLEKTICNYEEMKAFPITLEKNISLDSFIDEEKIILDATSPRILIQTKTNISEIFDVIPKPSDLNVQNTLTSSTGIKRSLSVSDIATKIEEKCIEKKDVFETPVLPMKIDSMIENKSVINKLNLTETKNKKDKSSKYTLIRTIGRGNFAKVKLAKHMATDKFVAIKIIDKTKLDKKVLRKITREVAVMKDLAHPNIVQLLEVMENETTLYIVMEYAGGGELFDFWTAHGSMKEDDARKKFRQIISAVQYCHSKGIVHRDLKAENLLLNKKMDIKLADFGFANRFNPESTLNTFCGSPPYAAPELFLGKQYVGPEVDIWALGVILFIMVGGRMPFDATTFPELRNKIINLRYEFPYFMSNECSNLIKKIFVVNMSDRATIEMIMDDHWLNGGGLPKVMKFTEESFIICPIIVQKLKEIGFNDADIKVTFKENKFNSIHATYFLLKQSLSQENNADQSFASDVFSSNDTVSKLNPIKHDSQIYPEHVRSYTDSQTHTATNAYNFIKSFKNWLFSTPEEPENFKKKESIISNESTSKDLLNEWQKAMPHMTKEMMSDVNSSIPKGANQEAILATLNQISITKHNKAGMFQGNILGTPQPKVPKTISKVSAETIQTGKFVVENVNVTQQINVPKKAKLNELRKEKVKSTKINEEENSEISMKAPKVPKHLAYNRTVSSNQGLTAAQINMIQVTWAKFDPKIKPNIANFVFNMNSTSSKHPDAIVQELIRVLNENNFSFDFLEKYLFSCFLNSKNIAIFGDSIQWEMEVCRIPLLFMHGVRTKRIFGSTFAYKKVISKITKSLKF